VALEGLRRLDEGIKPEEAFVDGDLSYLSEPEYADDHADDLVSDELAPEIKSAKKSQPVNPLSLTVEGTEDKGKSKMPVYAVVAAAVVLIVAAVGFPAGWYSRKAAPAAAQQQPAPQPEAAQSASNAPSDAPSGQPEQATPAASAPDTSASDAAALAARREREARERMKAAEKANALAKMQDGAATANTPGAEAVKKPEAPKPGPKMASVTVTYDEAGRVTSASGGDSNAIRIARQKRFPAGKAGSTTVTIPIN
jgi:cytoskeletal protein RodZ